MKCNSVIKELEQAIKTEEERIKSSTIASGQMSLIELSRSMDSYLVGANFRDERKGDDSYLDHLYQMGWTQAIRIFLDNSILKEGYPLFKTNTNFSGWADSIIQACGELAQAKQIVDYCKKGLAEPIRRERNDYYIKLLPARLRGVESLEREEFSWMSEFISNTYQKDYKNILKELIPTISSVMKEKVYTWREDYIGYDTTPEIDEYFLQVALLEAQKYIGNDSFSGDAKFGDLEFDHIRAAIVVLLSFSIKHTSFCLKLIEKNPDIKLRNILNNNQLIEDVAHSLSSALEIEKETALKILDLFILDNDNIKLHCEGIAEAPPPFITIAKGMIMYSATGFRVNPFLFMLKELKKRYPKDWDKAQNQREDAFRKELYELFPSDHYIKLDRPIIIKMNGKVVSDIDGFVFDKRTGVLGLFQLKWQEPFSHSMQERESRKKNFINKSNGWIEAVLEWIKDKTTDELANAFGVKASALKELKKIVLFVVGRNSAHFTGDEVPDERVAWGLWPQILRIVSENGLNDKEAFENPILWLYESLKSDSPMLKKIEVPDTEELKFGKYKLIVELNENK
ncbi:hypothetical protein H7S55_14725 [Priestia aryabhattai]|uniref:hypothetical protein n=1 Tax=Priestia aryabhattai TaxID=412384 RepID=UPI001C8ED7A7|nr:hypothetical protein [Priestia aryabhattai]MBY0001430.1 hypothetical protein [Priestia aryabhattai]